ncbi:hypothetical protein [Nonomuraea cavernae]|uniref:hypothetical protein n=1 Tax=Nonomuraea cavernae TaxID=2045107 RepID=UPI003410EDDB
MDWSTAMLKTSHICDWRAPYDDSDPLVIVISHLNSADSDLLLLDEDPELWEAFYATFRDDREINPAGCLSDYIYEVACLELDATPVMRSSAHWLRVTIG